MICLMPVSKRERSHVPIPCGHTNVHSGCLREWYTIAPTCPVCKTTNDAYLQREDNVANRAKRRRHMAAGLGKVSQEQEDVFLAVELSMFCECDNK